MWIFIVLAVLLAIFVLYLVLIAPSSKRGIREYRGVRFAHRGLHGNGRAENSMSAFRAAVESGELPRPYRINTKTDFREEF